MKDGEDYNAYIKVKSSLEREAKENRLDADRKKLDDEILAQGSGKTCTKCKKWKKRDCFHKNKNKRDGLESNCKKCVSLRKAKKYSRFKKSSKSTLETLGAFESYIKGQASDDSIRDFVEVFAEAYIGLKYEGKV